MNRRFGPGIWADSKGDLHFSVPELLDAFGWPHDADHEAMVGKVIREKMAEWAPEAEMVEQGACPHCGLEGLGVHALGCPYREAVQG